MIGPFSTTLVPLSSSSSVDRQELINVEASAISPDERQFGFIFTKIPFTRRSDDEEKKDQGAWTRSPVLSVCLHPPQKCLAPAATAGNQDTNSEENDLAVCKSKRASHTLRYSITRCGLACPVRVQWVSSHPAWAHAFHTIDRSTRPGHTHRGWLKPRPAGAQAVTGLFWMLIYLNVASKHLFRRHRASQTTALCAGGPDRSRRLIKGRSAF